MTGPSRVGAPRMRDETTFTRALRWEAFGEEGRALVGSWSISIALGLIWLLMVLFLPETSPDIDLTPREETVEITVTPEEAPPEPEPVVEAPAAASAPAPAVQRPAARPGGGGGPSAAQAASAFGGGNAGGVIGDVAGALRGVDVNTSTGGANIGGGKAVLGTGLGGAGTRTPGAGGFGAGTGAAAGTIGGVGSGAGIGRASVGVAPPRVVAPPVGGPARDVGELGSFVRGRQQQLQFCYQEFGLKVNPNLAGTVGVSVRLASSGQVTDANITNRTWSGAGASETEACIRQKVREWRFPSSERGEGTYGFSFSFSR